MAKVELFDGYFVESDPLNFTLKKKYKSQTEKGLVKEAEKIIGHYPNMQMALKRFVTLKQHDATADMVLSVGEYTEAIIKAEERVVARLKEILYEQQG